MIIVKNARALEKMRRACEVSQAALVVAGRACKPGMTTFEFDRIIAGFIKSEGGKASFLGYNGFKGSACISLNEELIHGVPSKKRVMNAGDIVTVDVGAYIDGYHGDNAATFVVGNVPVPETTTRLLETTEQSLYAGIRAARYGNRIGDIGHAIQTYAEERGFYIVRPWIGHGVGKQLHEDPEVPNFGTPGRGARLVPGMTLAIEPMINASTAETKQLKDGWTIVEANGNLCAHFEHTVAVTDGEPVIMTRVPPELRERVETFLGRL